MPSTTDPNDWFLPNVPATSGNLATPLIDGESYFRELHEVVTSLSGSRYLMVSGWRLNPATSIDPSDGTTVEDFIRALASDDVHMRSLLWYVPGTIGNFAAGHGPENLRFTELINSLGGEGLLDDRLPQGRFASHHQKYIVAGGADEHVAFLGGIDLAPDRWDTSDHDASSLREPELFSGWHDVQVRLRGPVVQQIWSAFRERWNDPRPPHAFPAIGGAVPTPMGDDEQPSVLAAGGTHSIQVLKTYACKSGSGVQSAYPFASTGDYSYERGLITAINNAEHFVYLEDQYFWPCAVADTLAAAVARGVAVILLLTRDYDVPGLNPYHNFLRASALQKLRDAENQVGSDRVFAYHLEQPEDRGAIAGEQIYLHAKTMVIDDRWMIIGSGNVNRRSMQTDSEIGVAIVDTHAVTSTIAGRQETVGDLPRAYRRQLWSEHLGVDAQDDPFDTQGRPRGFPTGDGQVGHVRRHTVAEPRFCQAAILPFGLMNARTTCNA